MHLHTLRLILDIIMHHAPKASTAQIETGEGTVTHLIVRYNLPNPHAIFENLDECEAQILNLFDVGLYDGYAEVPL